MHPLDILWYSRGTHPSPLGLAAQLGWFLDEFRDDGIRVFTVQGSDDPQMREAHLDHHLRHAVRQGGNVAAIWARSRGVGTRVVALSWIDEFQGILSRPDDTVRDLSDLRGRRLGLPVCDTYVDSTRAEALHGLLVALQTAGLAPSDAEFVDVPADRYLPHASDAQPWGPFGEYSRQIGALLRREVDVVYVKGARGLQAARAAQARILMDLRQHPDPAAHVHTGTPRPITVDQALLEEYPEVVARFLARVVAAGPWAARHPGETVAYLARETRSSEALVREAYGEDVHLHIGSNLDQRSVQALESHMRFLLDWGFIASPIDVQAWIDPAPLTAALARVNSPGYQAIWNPAALGKTADALADPVSA